MADDTTGVAARVLFEETLKRARAAVAADVALRDTLLEFKETGGEVENMPYGALQKMKNELQQRVSVRKERAAARGAARAAAVQYLVLSHQAPSNISAAADSLGPATGDEQHESEKSAFINAALRVHIEMGGAPVPAGDGLGNDADNACVKCGQAVDSLGISPEPGSATAGGTHCVQGVSNQCACFAGRIYRACTKCWSEHAEKAIATNIDHALCGKSFTCGIPCLACNGVTCAFRIKKATVVVPSAPRAAAQAPVPPPPQMAVRPMSEPVPPPAPVYHGVPPPSVALAPRPQLTATSAPVFAQNQPPTTYCDQSDILASSPIPEISAFDFDGLISEGDLPFFPDFDLGEDIQCGGGWTQEAGYPQAQAQHAVYPDVLQGLPGSNEPSPAVQGPMQLQPESYQTQLQTQLQTQPAHEQLDMKLNEFRGFLGQTVADMERQAAKIRTFLAKIKAESDPLALSGGGVTKRTLPPTRAKPATRRKQSTERACSVCKQVGHNKRRCSWVADRIEKGVRDILAQQQQ